MFRHAPTFSFLPKKPFHPTEVLPHRGAITTILTVLPSSHPNLPSVTSGPWTQLMEGTQAPGCQTQGSTSRSYCLDLSASLNWGAHSRLQTWPPVGFYDQMRPGCSPDLTMCFFWAPHAAPVCFCPGHLLLPAVHSPLNNLTQTHVFNTMYTPMVLETSFHFSRASRWSSPLPYNLGMPCPHSSIISLPSGQAQVLTPAALQENTKSSSASTALLISPLFRLPQHLNSQQHRIYYFILDILQLFPKCLLLLWKSFLPN